MLKRSVVLPSLSAILLSLLALCAMGQSCGALPQVPEPKPQPVVTDTIRQACQNWMVGDDALLDQLGNYREAYDAGVTHTEIFDSINNVAINYLSTPAQRLAYLTCMGAMVEEVW